MSSKPKANSRHDNLLAAIQRKAPVNVAETPVLEPPPRAVAATIAATNQPPPQKAAPPKSRRVGSPVQFWFHEEDRKLLRELAAWIAGQGVRPTDSLVIRAAIRTAKTGGEFLQAYRRASELDGRLKRRNAPMNTQSNETT